MTFSSKNHAGSIDASHEILKEQPRSGNNLGTTYRRFRQFDTKYGGRLSGAPVPDTRIGAATIATMKFPAFSVAADAGERVAWTELTAAAAVLAVASAAMWQGDADARVFLGINAMANLWLPSWLPGALTILGHGGVAVMLVAPFLLLDPPAAASVLAGAVPASLLSSGVKHLFARPRPAAVLPTGTFQVHGPVLAGHNSFPSGHSITIFLVVGGLLLASPWLRRHRLLGAALGMLAAAVAMSRVMVGAHWPSDVLAGAALGLVSAAAGRVMVARWISRGIGYRTELGMALLTLSVAVSLPWMNTGYPDGELTQRLLAGVGALCALACLWRQRQHWPAGKPPA